MCVREAASISIRVDGSVYRVAVYCAWEGVQTAFTSDTLCGLLEKLERFLVSGKAPWSPTSDARKKSAKGVDALIQ